jgi:glycerol uptake facilitator-like aquaporin
MQVSLSRRLVAEGLGTALLVAAVIGSGIMAQRLAGADVAVALLANTLATGAALLALILTFGSVSGAHFNPVVTACLAATREVSPRDAAGYIAAQITGGVAGAVVANTMFDLSPIAWAATARHGSGQILSEAVATFGLVGVVFATSRRRPATTPFAVAAYIVAAYWFTASTSFANPAVTIARAASDTFAGIRPVDVPAFIVAQAIGGGLAAVVFGWLTPREEQPPRRT